MRDLAVVFVMSAAMLISPMCEAAKSKKVPPWQWTLDERLQARSALGKMIYISGAKFPEKILPSELFSQLIRDVSQSPVQLQGIPLQGISDNAIISAGYDHHHFRQQILSIASEYVRLLEEYRVRVKELSHNEPPTRIDMTSPGSSQAGNIKVTPLTPVELMLQDQICRERYIALSKARKTFHNFDIFLYTAIAPRTSAFGVDPKDLGRLRAEETGCQ